MCGGYPLGAKDDPRAPYNQREPRRCVCPDCGGSGYADEPWAVSLMTGRSIRVTERAWQIMPATEDEARAKGQNYHRDVREACETCGGTGVAEDYGEDCEDDFDELAAEERYYERKYGTS